MVQLSKTITWFYGIAVFHRTLIGMLFSFLFLAQATKVLPLGTSYAIWTGIGALGAVIVGILLFKEPFTAQRIFFASLLLIGIIGLKATSGS